MCLWFTSVIANESYAKATFKGNMLTSWEKGLCLLVRAIECKQIVESEEEMWMNFFVK